MYIREFPPQSKYMHNSNYAPFKTELFRTFNHLADTSIQIDLQIRRDTSNLSKQERTIILILKG